MANNSRYKEDEGYRLNKIEISKSYYSRNKDTKEFKERLKLKCEKHKNLLETDAEYKQNYYKRKCDIASRCYNKRKNNPDFILKRRATEKKQRQKVQDNPLLKAQYVERCRERSRNNKKRFGVSAGNYLRKTVPERIIDVKKQLSFGVKKGSIIYDYTYSHEGDIFSRHRDHETFLELVCNNEINLEDWI